MLPTSFMSASHDRNKTATPPIGVGLKESAAAAFLAVSLSLAVIGLGAGIANADPGGNTPFDPPCQHCARGPVETQAPIFRPFEDPHTGGKPVDPNTGNKPKNPYTGK
jgi:hypothetical protein